MIPESWEWDDSESDGYNRLAALETTLLNFKIISEHDACTNDECRRFARKWTMINMASLARVVQQLNKKVEQLEEIIDVQVNEIFHLKEAMKNEADALWSDMKEVQSELSQEINDLEGNVADIGEGLSNLEHDMSTISNDVNHISKEVVDITKNLADIVLLDNR